MKTVGLYALAGLAACLFLGSGASAAERTTQALDKGWRFAKPGTETGQQMPRFNDSAWAKIDLPHTWNRVGGPQGKPYPGDSYSGPAWYRLHFAAPNGDKTAHYFLQFDGVGTIAEAWLNGEYLGKHEGAFARFRFDVSKVLIPGRDNILVVKADNSLPAPGSATAHVIPLSGDFFMHGGLYRSVSLVTTTPIHVDMMDYGGPGVYAQTTAVTQNAATIEVRARITNELAEMKSRRLSVRIEDAKGVTIARQSQPVTIKGAATETFIARLTVNKPHLWNGTADPYLYRVVATVLGPDGKAQDEVAQPFGLRTFAFDADKGFFLNGKHLFLDGVAIHQDAASKGWAMTCADQKRDFDIAEEMGANSVRLAHYQHDQCSYEEADRRGLVVWAEVPLVNHVSFDGSPASPALAANARQQLTELIRQNYNHPSIMMWSVGNEIDLRPTIANAASKAGALVRDMATLAHQEDPSRPSTMADCCEQSKSPDRDVLVGYTDLIGYNRYFGWYYGAFDDFGRMLDKAHAEHPKLPISISEYGAGAALTQHSDDPAGGPINPHGRPHPEEYQLAYHEATWKDLAARPYIWGVYIWNMFDFATAGREEGDLIDTNNKGMVTGDRVTRKDAFYFYQANWSTTPVLHLAGRRYNDRPYAVLDVKAYSNAANATLTVNGTPAGTAVCNGGICIWKGVSLDKGVNTLTATTASGLSDSLQWRYNGDPGTVRIKTGDLSGITTTEGLRFGSDVWFSGGTAKGINPPDTAAKARIAVEATDPPLYDSYREGEFSYRIPLPEGRYRVTLHFVEPSARAAGERLFEVRTNGKVVLKDVDVFAAAGGNHKGYAQSFSAETSGGFLLLDFHASKGKAVLSAIEVTPK